jgi:hypothetical protein
MLMQSRFLDDGRTEKFVFITWRISKPSSQLIISKPELNLLCGGSESCDENPLQPASAELSLQQCLVRISYHWDCSFGDVQPQPAGKVLKSLIVVGPNFFAWVGNIKGWICWIWRVRQVDHRDCSVRTRNMCDASSLNIALSVLMDRLNGTQL